MTDDKSNPFDDGYIAARDGVPVENNPYENVSSFYAESWTDGWWAFFYSEDDFDYEDI